MQIANQRKTINVIFVLLIISTLIIVGLKILVINDKTNRDLENLDESIQQMMSENPSQSNLSLDNQSIINTKQGTLVDFENLSFINIINDTTGLIEKVNITIDVNVTYYTTLVILDFDLRVDEIGIFGVPQWKIKGNSNFQQQI